MKDSRSSNSKQSKQVPASHTPRPQNKDDIDSRSNEEQDTKGDDITHNQKEVHSSKSHKKP